MFVENEHMKIEREQLKHRSLFHAIKHDGLSTKNTGILYFFVYTLRGQFE